MERAAFYAAWQEKKLRGLFLTAAGNSGAAPSAGIGMTRAMETDFPNPVKFGS
jgi:hypothetical protein